MTEEEKQDIIEQLKKGAKRYTCCCGETFSKMYNFRKHLLKRHRKEWDECFEKIKVKSISTDKNLGAHIIETNDEYLFCYSTKNTFKLDASSKGIKKEKKKKSKKKKDQITYISFTSNKNIALPSVFRPQDNILKEIKDEIPSSTAIKVINKDENTEHSDVKPNSGLSYRSLSELIKNGTKERVRYKFCCAICKQMHYNGYLYRKGNTERFVCKYCADEINKNDYHTKLIYTPMGNKR